jgi:hypothetical protein
VKRFGLLSGVLLHRGGDLPDTSLLLDGTPGAASAWDTDLRAALPVGTPVTVAGGQFTITVEGLSASAATVRVAAAPAATPPVAAGQPVAPAPRVLPQPSSAGQQPAGGTTAAAPATAVASGGAGTGRATTPSATGGSGPAGGGASPAPSARLHEAADLRPSGAGPFPLALGGLGGCAVLAVTVTVRRRRRRRALRGPGRDPGR